MSSTALPAAIERPRAFVSLSGPDAAEFLERMVSNEVEALAPGESCEALLLTPKSRVIATLVVVRRASEDFLLVTEPDLGDVVAETLLRARFAAKVTVGSEEHSSHVVLATSPPEGASWWFATDAYGVGALEVIDSPVPAGTRVLDEEAAELLRIEAGTPAIGREIDDRVLPAEAGLVERAVSFTKGCYPGQEPVARLHHRGHVNRELRVIVIDTPEPPDRDADVCLGERVVGRVTSAISRDQESVALAYVRAEVAADAKLVVNGASARLTVRRRP